MPYIKPSDRTLFDGLITQLSKEITSEGKLNYVITRLANEYLKHLEATDGVTYRHFNAVVGVLECVKQEWYGRMVIPYEERKCLENGDVYP